MGVQIAQKEAIQEDECEAYDTGYDKADKGTSRGLEALQKQLNDSYHTHLSA